MPVCRELKTPEDFAGLMPLIRQHNPQLTEEDITRRFGAMQAAGYRAVGVFDGDTLIGASGFWIGWRFWCGKYIDIDNFVVEETRRGKGAGRALLDWIEAEARREACDLAVLDVYAGNHSAQKFYFREGYFIAGYHMVKSMRADGGLPPGAQFKKH